MSGASPVSGDLEDVRFADVEDALRDRRRLAWVLPVIDGMPDEATSDRRTLALAAGVRAGLRGVTLVDYAMGRCPT